MSKLQRIVLAIGTVLFVLVGLFPPIKISGSILNLGHTFLFHGAYGYIDFINLLTRWIIIIVSFAVLIYLLRQKVRKNKPGEK